MYFQGTSDYCNKCSLIRIARFKHGISLNIKITVQAGKLALKALHNKGEISPTPTRVKNYSNHFYQMLTGKIEPSEELKSLLEE